jgi:tetratricopeptide (TPR) repeat protein
MDRDWSGATKSGESALEQISLTQEIARRKRDYYLLDEPKVVDTNDQWKALDQPVGPISTDIVSTVKVLMGLAAARLAEAQLAAQVASLQHNEPVQPQVDKDITALLDTSDLLVRRATEKVPEESAEGFDPDNAIAPYVRGLVAETRARLATYSKPGDAAAVKDVADARQRAVDAYEALKPALEKWGADVTASFLIADAQKRLAAISSTARARAEAKVLNQSGRATDAWVVLGDALELHASKEVVIDRADAARRGRRPGDLSLAEIDRAVETQAIPAGDLAAAVARAAIVLHDVGTTLAQRDNGRPVAVDRNPLLEKLEPVESSLRKAIDGLPPNAAARPRGWAWLALCLAYQSQITDDAAASSNYIKETQRLAQDALFELTKAPPQKDAWDPGYVEAVVSAQLALGHAAAKTLPSHRDESRLAFAAAIDNATSLPFADADFRMLGSPLLAALAAGDSGGGAKLAQEERALRQMMTRFVEASFALRFGSPEQAASQMAEAVTLGNSATDEREAHFDASTELSRADGFDVHISLPDSIRAFAALSQITAGQPETALRTLVEITSPGAKIPPGDDWLASPAGHKLVRQSLSRIHSPLAGYAMASALESVVDRVDLSRVVETQPLLELAIRAQKQTESLLSATRIAGRYPHIQELSLQLGRRLSDPDFHRKQAAAAVETGNVPAAISGLRAALRRQPKESSLWQMLLTLHVNQLAIAYSDRKATELREELAIATRLDLLTPYHKYFFAGELLFLQGQYDEAAKQFESALESATSASDRACAVAKVTTARLRTPRKATTESGTQSRFSDSLTSN